MESIRREADLRWRGPFIFGDSAASDHPGKEPGVYIWTIPTAEGRWLCRVGEAVSLLERWPAHFQSRLGGYDAVYDPACLKNGKELKCLYKGAAKEALPIGFSRELAAAAWENMATYEWYWAVWPGCAEQRFRKSVESAIHHSVECSSYGRMLFPWRGNGPDKCELVRCVSRWPADVQILGLDDEIIYPPSPGVSLRRP